MSNPSHIIPVGRFKDVDSFRARLAELRCGIELDEQILAGNSSPLAEPVIVQDSARRLRIGNRFCIQPMEGWDCDAAGRPTELTLRRWRRFGASGAKLIWTEAAAVQPDGRSSDRQLLIVPENASALAELLRQLRDAHKQRFGSLEGLIVGIQLTHGGRFARPVPRIAFHHPVLDERFGIAPDHPLLSDAEIDRIIENFVRAARVAVDVGFDFVDIKHCHGYLGAELLAAHTRRGRYGGTLENRTRFMRRIVLGIRQQLPQLPVAVRLSAFDVVPYRAHRDAVTGRPVGMAVEFRHLLPYRYAFGVRFDDPTRIDLDEPLEVIGQLQRLGVRLVNISGGSPYSCPHLQRPALFPVVGGYCPPADPLLAVDTHLRVVAEIKARYPAMVVVGSAYSYLQQFLPHVAQRQVAAGRVDIVGLGRQALSYPQMPADVLERGKLDHKRICRTIGDCSNAPRLGLPSGCYVLDDFYKSSDYHRQLRLRKRDAAEGKVQQ